MDKNLDHFLHKAGWEHSTIKWFNADWSTRRYGRLTKVNGDTSILLDSPPDHSPESMVGHQIGAWSKINKHLRSLGLNAPQIIAEDLDRGFILMDDFGEDNLVNKSRDIFLKATDILIIMRDHPQAKNIDLLDYKDTHVYKALRFYPRYVLGKNNLEDEWFTVWNEVERALPVCPQIFTHIDFNATNLMWVDGQVGILDFQGACFAPFVYDMVNLLDDARRVIADDIKHVCIDHYCATLSPIEKESFYAWYPVIAAQFHARVLGQILKLKDENGRGDLMRYYDDLSQRFEKELHAPALAPILRFIKDNE
jgi:hypothetical protein